MTPQDENEQGTTPGPEPESKPVTWKGESRILFRSACPLVLTCILQYSFISVSMLVVGRLGTKELGAVSLANTTVTIVAYSVYQGFAQALDTLCPQAYGHGNKKYVSIYVQRASCILYVVTIPIGVIFWYSETIIGAILPQEKEVVHLTALYLRIVIVGLPGYATFECGKRFLQAQGIFSANLRILLVLAPFNVFLQWVLVWQMGLGYIGCPIAVAIILNLQLVALIFYVFFLGNGKECWRAPTRALVFTQWGSMLRLAIPCFVAVLSVSISFEILTIWAGLMGAGYLAAQGVLINLANLFAQMLTPIGIAAATRGSHLIGAGDVKQARLAAKVAFAGCILSALVNLTVLMAGTKVFPRLFSLRGDPRVYAEQMIPFVAVFQLLDAICICTICLLRSIGAQKVGGYVGAFVLNGVALPLSYVTGFTLHWHLFGLWFGVTVALIIAEAICGSYLFFSNWERAVREAQERAPLLSDA